MMRERPLLFSGAMVREILADRKRQTRRVYTPRECEPYEVMGEIMDGPSRGKPWPHWFSPDEGPEYHPVECKYGVPGDHLYVKETHSQVITKPVPTARAWWPGREPWPGVPADRPRHTIDADRCIIYRADGEMPGGFKQQWKPSIFMRREYSRITLEIKSVRVERLQDLSESDAKAEGVTPLQMDHGSYLHGFHALWDTINGKDHAKSWESNPWAWAIEFQRIPPEAR